MSVITFLIGLLAQGFFSARIIVQWILSEKAKKVLSPNIFWIFSLSGSVLLFIYGWLRSDFAIIFGQLISYYIYIWNLRAKGVWQKMHAPSRVGLMALPVVAVSLMVQQAETFVQDFFQNSDIPLWLLLMGSLGQVIFTMRFIYQWYYSHRLHDSVLPIGFWIISLIGSSIIVTYGIIRLDPIIILGQSFGFIAYIRNIMIYRKDKKCSANQSIQ